MLDADKLLENLSTHLRSSIARSLSLATSLSHTQVTPLHLLYGIAEEQGSVGAEILKKLEVNAEIIFTCLSLNGSILSSEKTVNIKIPELNNAAKQTLEKAMLTAHERQHRHVGTEHLLFGIACGKDTDITQLLKQVDVTKKNIKEQVEIILQSTSKFPHIEEISETLEQFQNLNEEKMNSQPQEPIPTKKFKNNKRSTSAIELFTVNLTEKQIQKTIDPVIGRDEEIERIIHILSRRTKNNPILIGEPGVGKTAIIEGLAKKITTGNVPYHLKNKKIISLDLTLLIAGTIYRGEFEARLKQIIDEITANPDYILFVDEVHNIIGAGSNQGTMDAANILKPALARGQLRCIGATTLKEYKKYISSDAALERRFQSVIVEEPSLEEAVEIIKGIKPYYEKFHETDISLEAIKAAVALSSKYIQENHLPDKAIDLLDEAAARVKTNAYNSPLENEYQALLFQLTECKLNKEQAISEEEFEIASSLKKEEKELKEELNKIKKRLKIARKKCYPQVEEKDIAHILGQKLHIKPEILLMHEWEKVKHACKNLKKHIIGQDHVIDQIASALGQAHLGLDTTNRPLASFLFTGPSGTGKTELAKKLALGLYHDHKALIKLEMSEYSEAHSTAKLLGSPAGYVGYQDRNKFTDHIRQRPYSIILFDEIDKAHPNVHKLLLQILDEGKLTDSSGKVVNFNHSIIILTANTGSEAFKSSGIGFGHSKNTTNEINPLIKEKMHSRLKDQFGNALLGRINNICLFNPLSKESIEKILRNQIRLMNKTLEKKQNISIKPDKRALTEFAKKHIHADHGVRNIEKNLQKLIEQLVIEIANTPRKAKKTYRLKKTAEAFELV